MRLGRSQVNNQQPPIGAPLDGGSRNSQCHPSHVVSPLSERPGLGRSLSSVAAARFHICGPRRRDETTDQTRALGAKVTIRSMRKPGRPGVRRHAVFAAGFRRTWRPRLKVARLTGSSGGHSAIIGPTLWAGINGFKRFASTSALVRQLASPADALAGYGCRHPSRRWHVRSVSKTTSTAS